MTAYHEIEPEVAGKLGEQTEMDTSVHPPNVQNIHYQFDGWLGDDLLTSFPCYLVTDRLADLLASRSLSGYGLDDVTVTKSLTFEERHPDRDLPEFHWLRVVGDPGVDDFWMGANDRLVVSGDALDVLRAATLEYAEIDDYDPDA